MPDPFTATAGVTALVVYVAKTSYDYLLKSKNGTDKQVKECEAREVQESVQASLDAQTELLKGIAMDQRDTRDGVMQLVTIQKQRSR